MREKERCLERWSWWRRRQISGDEAEGEDWDEMMLLQSWLFSIMLAVGWGCWWWWRWWANHNHSDDDDDDDDDDMGNDSEMRAMTVMKMMRSTTMMMVMMIAVGMISMVVTMVMIITLLLVMVMSVMLINFWLKYLKYQALRENHFTHKRPLKLCKLRSDVGCYYSQWACFCN